MHLGASNKLGLKLIDDTTVGLPTIVSMQSRSRVKCLTKLRSHSTRYVEYRAYFDVTRPLLHHIDNSTVPQAHYVVQLPTTPIAPQYVSDLKNQFS